MKEIAYLRLDDRLVHGQIIGVWVNEIDFDTLIVVDDNAANDNIQRMVIEMAVPKTIKFKLFTLKDFIEYFKEQEKEKIFLIVGSVDSAEKLIKSDLEIKNLNIGNISPRKDRKQYSKSVWCTDKEKEKIKNLIKEGVKIYIHLVPNEKKRNAKEIIK